MGAFQHGHHAQAFILLALTEGPSYGVKLHERIEKKIPGNKLDRPFLYRTLNRLEREGKVNLHLDDSQSGPVRKYYSLTERGWNELAEFEKDIRFRVKTLSFFLDEYGRIKKGK
jgi:PadR family transcriptional regulator PadR